MQHLNVIVRVRLIFIYLFCKHRASIQVSCYCYII